jgi:hypothetical protein
LASANFSEVRSLHKKCRMKSIDLAAQLRNLGLTRFDQWNKKGIK